MTCLRHSWSIPGSVQQLEIPLLPQKVTPTSTSTRKHIPAKLPGSNSGDELNTHIATCCRSQELTFCMYLCLQVVDAFSAADSLKLVLSTFALVFAAEWGDKSFLATIALAAASSPLGVTAGAVAGHGVATGIAVAGGGLLSKYFSETVLQYVGGSLFLVFAASTVVDIVDQLKPALP